MSVETVGVLATLVAVIDFSTYNSTDSNRCLDTRKFEKYLMILSSAMFVRSLMNQRRLSSINKQ